MLLRRYISQLSFLKKGIGPLPQQEQIHPMDKEGPWKTDEKVKITKDKTKKYSITKLHKIPV